MRNIIDKLAQFVARNGPEFEQMTKNKQAGNAKFMFLFGGEHHAYYQYRVNAERPSCGGEPNFGHNLPPAPPNLNPPFYPMNCSQPAPSFGQFPGALPMTPLKANPSIDGPPYGNNNLLPPPPLPPHLQRPSPSMGQSLPLPPSLFQPPSKFPVSSEAPPNPPPFGVGWSHPPSMDQNPIAPLPPPPQPPPSLPVNQANLHMIKQEIEQLREKISESERNLSLQYRLIMENEMNSKIEETITKLLDDELRRMCEDYDINLNEFDKMLKPIIESCRKESIAVSCSSFHHLYK